MDTPNISFPGFAKAYENLNATRQGIRSRPFYFDLDLSIARSLANNTAQVLEFTGNVLYIDQNPSDGNATVYFEDQATDKVACPFYVSPGSIFKMTYSRLTFENAAQAGKKIRIIYGVDLDFSPNTSSQTATIVSNTTANPIPVSALNPLPVISRQGYTNSYQNGQAMAAASPNQIIAPASNVNGAVIHRATINSFVPAGPGNVVTMLAKNANPTSAVDGDVILIALNTITSGGNNYVGVLERDILIPAGKGLYFWANIGESTGTRQVLYTLL